MYVIQNLLKGKFNILYSKKVNAFVLHYSKENKISYFQFKQYSIQELKKSIIKASNIGKCFEELSHNYIKSLIHKDDSKEDKNIITYSHRIKDDITRYDKLLNYIKKLFKSDISLTDIKLCYNIYYRLCIMYNIQIIVAEPIEEIETNYGIDFLNNYKEKDYIEKLKKELFCILDKIKTDELQFNNDTFFVDYFENMFLSLLINGNVKKSSVELRNFKRGIQTFCNKYGSPCFIHIPQKIEIPKENVNATLNEKLMTTVLPLQNEYKQFSKFTANNIKNSIPNIYQLKNKILLNKDNQEFIINELNININPFIYMCFWLYKLIPISNKYIKKEYGRLKEEDYFVQNNDKYFRKSSNRDDYLIIFKEEVEKINQRIIKETSKCNYTNLSQTYTDTISFISDIDSYDAEITIYSNITLCIWELFYNDYFLKQELFISDDNLISKTTCINCNNIIIDKKHLLRNIASNNKYGILPYLCDTCMKERNKKSGIKRINRYRNK